MTPLIQVGSTVSVSKVEKEELKPFDIILFDQGGRLNCHFLSHFDHERNSYSTRSLKSPQGTDFPLEWNSILGKVTNKKIGLFQKARVLLLCALN